MKIIFIKVKVVQETIKGKPAKDLTKASVLLGAVAGMITDVLNLLVESLDMECTSVGKD